MSEEEYIGKIDLILLPDIDIRDTRPEIIYGLSERQNFLLQKMNSCCSARGKNYREALGILIPEHAIVSELLRRNIAFYDGVKKRLQCRCWNELMRSTFDIAWFKYSVLAGCEGRREFDDLASWADVRESPYYSELNL